MDLQSIENEVMAWRERFPQYEYRRKDDCVALKLEQVRYGCHCDLDEGMTHDSCVLDQGRPQDCVSAGKLFRDGKGKEQCSDWRPITLTHKA
jgi:hypothetical protein